MRSDVLVFNLDKRYPSVICNRFLLFFKKVIENLNKFKYIIFDFNCLKVQIFNYGCFCKVDKNVIEYFSFFFFIIIYFSGMMVLVNEIFTISTNYIPKKDSQ